MNPIRRHELWSLKDPCMAWRDGWVYLFYSVFHDGNQSRLRGERTRDFLDFEELFDWGAGANGWCSPDLQFIDGRWYLTYQSWDGLSGSEDRNKALFYATSDDLVHWHAHRPLAVDATGANRAIDPTIAQHNGCYYLLWKEWQTPQLAVSNGIGERGWKRLGNPFNTWAENGQFLKIDGRWQVVVHARPPEEHGRVPKTRPRSFLLPMIGSGDREGDWMNWGPWREIVLPEQAGFNDDGRINAPFIADWRALDGHFYTIFCARRQGAAGGNMGHTLGLARSRDLATWELPPGNG
jgi:hypothetical protein